MPRRDVMPKPRPRDWRTVAYTVCGRKTPMTRRQAAAVAERERHRKLRAYRCPFGTGHWHVGHVPSMKTLREIATAIRARANDTTATTPL